MRCARRAHMAFGKYPELKIKLDFMNSKYTRNTQSKNDSNISGYVDMWSLYSLYYYCKCSQLSYFKYDEQTAHPQWKAFKHRSIEDDREIQTTTQHAFRITVQWSIIFWEHSLRSWWFVFTTHRWYGMKLKWLLCPNAFVDSLITLIETKWSLQLIVLFLLPRLCHPTNYYRCVCIGLPLLLEYCHTQTPTQQYIHIDTTFVVYYFRAF